MRHQNKSRPRQRRFHKADLETLEDEFDIPDWVAGAYKWRSVR